MDLTKETSKKDSKGYSNMMGLSKSTAAQSTNSIKSATSIGIRTHAFEIKKHATKVQPKKEFDSNANPYTENKNKK
jgi:hypothetical protein